MDGKAKEEVVAATALDKPAVMSASRKEERHCLQVFCNDKFAPTLYTTRRRALAVVAFCLTLTAVFGGLGSTLKSSAKDFRAESFPPTSNIMQFFDSASRFGASGNNVAWLYFIVGVGPSGTPAIDRSAVDPNNPKELGWPVFESNPEFSSEAAQRHLLRICEMWKDNSLVRSGAYPPAPVENGVACFAEHFRDWLGAMGEVYPVVPAEDFVPLLANFTSVPSNTTCHDDAKVVPGSRMRQECAAYHDTIHRYPSAFRWGAPEHAWNDQVRWSTGTDDPPLEADAMEEYSTPFVLRGFAIQMNFTMEWDVSGINARKLFDELEVTQRKINEEAPTGALEGFHVNWQGEDSGSKWMQMRTDEIMQSSAGLGCIVSVIVAMMVLAVATTNVLLAALAFVAIACIVVSCIGFMVMAGWSFGMIEAICVTICVGFSIDFVAHLAVAYNEAPDGLSRFERTQEALDELGLSVTAAAITTCGSAIFMLPNWLVPFAKIGAFIVFDISISLLFAVLLFSGMLRLCGPRDSSHGSVLWMFHRAAAVAGCRRTIEQSRPVVKTHSQHVQRSAKVEPDVPNRTEAELPRQ